MWNFQMAHCVIQCHCLIPAILSVITSVKYAYEKTRIVFICILYAILSATISVKSS